MPGATAFRKVSIALKYLVSTLLMHWSIDNMSTVTQEIRSEFADLTKYGSSRVCICCGSHMANPTVKTFDAGQAYQMIKSATVLRDLEYIVKQAHQSSAGLLQMYNHVRSIVGGTKSLRKSFDDRVVIATKSIVSCVSAYVNFHIFRLGNLFVKQVSGFPIGGWLSSSLLNLVAGACESMFEKR